MTPSLATRLARAVAAVPQAYDGPGGAIGVVRNGEVLVRHAWGWANAERRIPFTARTLFRICSITKQFTCALVLDACRDPTILDGAVRARLPLLEQPAPGALQLCHNQSGLRDYWAVAMLHGSPVEAPFGDAEAMRIVAGTRTLHFTPGTRFSYVNQNFRILSEILQERSGRSFAELLRRRLFERARMPSAMLAAETAAMPDGTEGYEGNPASGFRPAVNRVLWTGDAGIGASLDDMVAWEQHIDAARDDPESICGRLAAPATFADGNVAPYGYGLHRKTELGVAVTGHGGALRGWRSHRMYVPSERVSVVVMFNHMADAHAAALDLLAAVLDRARPDSAKEIPAPAWLGAYIEPQTGLAVRVEAAKPGHARLRYGHSAETLAFQADGTVGDETTRLRADETGLWMDRPQENQSSRLNPLAGSASDGLVGRYRCAELEAEISVAESGGVLYGGFSGFLGQGRMERLDHVGGDVWTLPCPRALDHTPPGDWTLAFQRDKTGGIAEVQVGCWLARGLRYVRAE